MVTLFADTHTWLREVTLTARRRQPAWRLWARAPVTSAWSETIARVTSSNGINGTMASNLAAGVSRVPLYIQLVFLPQFNHQQSLTDHIWIAFNLRWDAFLPPTVIAIKYFSITSGRLCNTCPINLYNYRPTMQIQSIYRARVEICNSFTNPSLL